MKSANQPEGDELTLDHSGHFVADANAARQALSALGFTVTPFSAQVQPDPISGQPRLTGTGNICVMLPSGYLEFLVYTAPTPIGREFQAALERRAGLHLCAFGVADAARRHCELVANGIEMRPIVHFARAVETLDGKATAAFTVARMAAGTMPEGRVQILTHHNAAAMWQSRWTRHANGAQALQAMIVSSPDPNQAARRFGKFLGRDPLPAGAGQRLELDRGVVEFLPEDIASELVGYAVEPGRSCFVGLRIGVEDLSPLRCQAGAQTLGETVTLPFAPALGAGIWVFEQA